MLACKLAVALDAFRGVLECVLVCVVVCVLVCVLVCVFGWRDFSLCS